MLKMLLFGLTKHQHVIKVNYHKLSKEWLEYLIHAPHGCACGITEAEGHDYPLIKSNLSLKGGLPLIWFTNSDLLMPTPYVYLGKVYRPVEFINHVLKSWEGIPIFDCDFVDGSAIYTFL